MANNKKTKERCDRNTLFCLSFDKQLYLYMSNSIVCEAILSQHETQLHWFFVHNQR